MSKMSPKKLKKKKERDKKVKQKLDAQREANRKKNKKENEEAKEKLRVQRAANRIKGTTIRKNKKSSEEVVSQLEHNLDILKALEEEHKAMQESQDNATQVNLENVPEEVTRKSFSASAAVTFTPKIEEPKSE